MKSSDNADVATQGYVVPCSSVFRDQATACCHARQISVADLARGVLLLIGEDLICAYPDPGEPERTDRERVTVQSGSANGRTLLRKPRLQVRLEKGLRFDTIRRALSIGIELHHGKQALQLHLGKDIVSFESRLSRTEDDNQRLRRWLDELMFVPFDNGVRNRMDALHIMGFAPSLRPEIKAVRERFRRLVKIYHPDSPCGDHVRMAQLNDAARILLDSSLR